MKQNKYGAWAIGAWMLLLTAVSCTDSYEGTPVNMFTEDYLFSRTDSNCVVARQFLNRIYWYMRNGHNGVNGDYLDAASDDALSVTHIPIDRSEEHTSELQSLPRNSYAVFCLKKKIALLRCFSSGGSPHMPMDSAYVTWTFLHVFFFLMIRRPPRSTPL